LSRAIRRLKAFDSMTRKSGQQFSEKIMLK